MRAIWILLTILVVAFSSTTTVVGSSAVVEDGRSFGTLASSTSNDVSQGDLNSRCFGTQKPSASTMESFCVSRGLMVSDGCLCGPYILNTTTGVVMDRGLPGSSSSGSSSSLSEETSESLCALGTWDAWMEAYYRGLCMEIFCYLDECLLINTIDGVVVSQPDEQDGKNLTSASSGKYLYVTSTNAAGTGSSFGYMIAEMQPNKRCFATKVKGATTYGYGYSDKSLIEVTDTIQSGSSTFSLELKHKDTSASVPLAISVLQSGSPGLYYSTFWVRRHQTDCSNDNGSDFGTLDVHAGGTSCRGVNWGTSKSSEVPDKVTRMMIAAAASSEESISDKIDASYYPSESSCQENAEADTAACVATGSGSDSNSITCSYPGGSSLVSSYQNFFTVFVPLDGVVGGASVNCDY